VIYYFAIITFVIMPRTDPSETNCPYLRVGCYKVERQSAYSAASAYCAFFLG
jgi:hypothetical protein